MKETHEPIKEILDIIDKVRIECPWVKERKAKEHIEKLNEEIEEAKIAMNNNDLENLTEELGDILWDVLLLIKICKEEKGINTKEVMEKLKQKMIRRRPYIYGNEKATTPEETLIIWNRIKKEEKKSNSKKIISS